MHELKFVVLPKPDEQRVSAVQLPKGAKVLVPLGRVMQSRLMVQTPMGPGREGQYLPGLLVKADFSKDKLEDRYFVITEPDNPIEEMTDYVGELVLPDGRPLYIFELKQAPSRLIS